MKKGVICNLIMQLKNNIILLLAILCSGVVHAQVTKVGNDTLYDVACWNVEWFGDAAEGPSNELTQYNNVKLIITNTEVDVWGLCEVSDPTTFYNLLNELPSYQGVLSTYNQTQKTALIFNRDLFELMSSNLITDQTNPDFYNAFASGRYPFEVVLRTKMYPFDSVYFYVVHLKANSGSADQASYNRRSNASLYLQQFLNTQRANKKIVVLGDFNDDVDQSVVRINSSYLASPFQNFINDSNRYFFPSKQLSLAGETTYPNYKPINMIDHILTSRALSDSFYVNQSAVVLKQLSAQISSYLSNTSDHYPVLTRFNLKRYPKATPIDTSQKDTIPNTGVDELVRVGFNIYPNPTQGFLTIDAELDIQTIALFNHMGELIYTAQPTKNARVIVLPEHVKNGMYLLLIQTPLGEVHKRIHLVRN
jgi:endonuclease/exonuclease/phosphatase family metal-dependent hydrolase